MILRNLAVVCLGIVWFKGVCGASFSQVYVHNGLSGYQLPTVAYGAPVTPGSQSHQPQQNAPPIGSVVPYQQPASFNPCVIPCIQVPSQAYGQPYTPVEKARVVYNTPNTVVVAPNAPSGYEYSYVVYDDQPGGQKSQKQWSNGPQWSNVPFGQFGQFGQLFQGQYSFRQPGGYVVPQPQVQFTAEDLKGFNTVIKSYLPSALPNYFPNVKPIYLIRAEPCEDPPKSANNTNATEPVGKDDKNDKSKKKVDPKSFDIPDLIEDPIVEETTTSTTTTTTTEKPTTEISSTTITEATTTTTTEVPKAEQKTSPDEVKLKPPVEPEVSEPIVAASNAYAHVVRCIQESMKKPGQGGPSPLTYIVSPNTPC